MRIPAALAVWLSAAAAHGAVMPPLAFDPLPPPLLAAVEPGPNILARAEPAADAPFREREAYLTAAFLTANGGDKPEAARLLARFYADARFCPEAIATLANIETWTDEDGDLAARCEVMLGRFDAALDRLDRAGRTQDATVRGIRALALVGLGAHASAAADFDLAAPPKGNEATFFLAKAEAMLAANRLDEARSGLAAAGALAPGSEAAAQAQLIAARIDAVAGRSDEARRALKTLAAHAPEPWAVRAALQILIADSAAGAIDAGEAVARLERLGLRWRGGAFEREWLAATAAIAQQKNFVVAFLARRRLAEHHPRSDAGVAARAALPAMLSGVFDQTMDLSARDKAELFFESVEYAPPGEEGDALIREAAQRLAALDLLEEAAALLEHQVFERLRGAERAAIAVDLGRLYLDDRRPEEALRVMRSTRIAGLNASTVTRRRLVEAEALLETAEPRAAIALLERESGPEARTLVAAAHWAARDWPSAAAAYRALALQPGMAKSAGDAAVRAASAFLVAGDEQGFAAFRAEIAPRLRGTPHGDLIESYDLGAKEPDAFMNAYRALYADAS